MFALEAGYARAQAIPIEKAAAPANAAGAVFTVSGGSYYLSKNIVLKGGARNAINITGPNVSIDFRGYGIIGKNSAGIGINAANQANITIQYGNIIGMGGGAVVVGTGSTVRSMHVSGGGTGITCDASCVIEDNVVSGVTADGIDGAGLIEHNVCDNNGGDGIKTSPGTNSSLIGNEVSGNAGTGLAMQSHDGFIGNVINSTAITTSGGVDGGNNVCNGSKACP